MSQRIRGVLTRGDLLLGLWLLACAHGPGIRGEDPTVSERTERAVEPELELSEYKLQAWDDRFYREELVPAIRNFKAGHPELATALLYRARTEVSRARDVGALRALEHDLDARTNGAPSDVMASDSSCLSPYGTSEEWLDRDIEEIRSVAADERRSYGGILTITIMDVLGVASRGGQRMAMAIDVFEAGPLAGEDDDLFELLQGGFDREYIEETPGPNFTVATIPHGAVLRLVEAIRRVNGSSERSNCFTRSMELVLVEASRPDRRLVVVAD